MEHGKQGSQTQFLPLSDSNITPYPPLASRIADASLGGQEGAVSVCHVHRRLLSHDLRADGHDQRSSGFSFSLLCPGHRQSGPASSAQSAQNHIVSYVQECTSCTYAHARSSVRTYQRVLRYVHSPAQEKQHAKEDTGDHAQNRLGPTHGIRESYLIIGWCVVL